MIMKTSTSPGSVRIDEAGQRGLARTARTAPSFGQPAGLSLHAFLKILPILPVEGAIFLGQDTEKIAPLLVLSEVAVKRRQVFGQNSVAITLLQQLPPVLT